MRPQIGLVALVVAAGLAGSVPVLTAQSLGDIGRKEEERRKEVKTPAKVYTNKDLGAVPPSLAAPADAGKAAAPAAPAAPDANAGTAGDDKSKAAPEKNQAYWSGRQKDLQTKLDRDRVLSDAMQSRINGLNADFTARDDPAQRAVIGADLQRALAELQQLGKSIKDDQKALDDFGEEARKAGVPPGWLR